MQLTTFTEFIPETALPTLAKRIAKVNRQADKLNVDPIRFDLTGRVEDRETPGKRFVFAGHAITPTKRFIEVSVTGAQPKLPGGWKLLGVVDHREAVPIVKSVPGCDMPPGQRDRGPVCDHCATKRRRVDTFILQATEDSEDGRRGDVVQVGRQCLGDFLGLAVNDPANQLNWWISVAEVAKDFDTDDSGDSFGPRGRAMISIDKITLIALACIDEFGWVSKGRAREDATGQVAATADLIANILNPPHPHAKAAYREWRALVDTVEARVNEALHQEARDAIVWALSHETVGDNDYLHNLYACAVSGQVGYDKLGLVASLPASYRREQDRLKQAERKDALGASSKFVGEPKERLTLTLTLLDRPIANEGNYGVTYRCEFSDENGNFFQWWASNDPTREHTLNWAVGEAKLVKATVKKHDTFRNIKRTVVNRVAEVRTSKPKRDDAQAQQDVVAQDKS